jgi:nucleoid-associated protein YgaU
MMVFYMASGWLQRANERLTYAKDIKADVNFKDAYREASGDITDAKTLLDTEEYVKSANFSKAAIAALENIQVIAAVAPAPAKIAPAEPKAPPLPGTYTVRLIMARRDCFWRIAGYPFVYNDPWKWKTLYAANKSVLTDPNNPDLIQPGQIFTIPSLEGEEREGEYDPDQTYTPLTGK